MATASLFGDDQVDLPRLRERAHNFRWAVLPPDVIPLSSADPDFPTAVEIRTAIQEYVASGVLSYGPAEGLRAFREAAATALSRRRGLANHPDRVFPTDSVASGMHVVAAALLEPGDEAIILDPVDFLFRQAVERAGGRAVLWPLTFDGEIDIDRLKSLVTPRTRLLCLCNPHNPLGRVFVPSELEAISQVAIAADLHILSDEIWSDIVYSPHRHTSIATLGDDVAMRTFTLFGFSKSHALAGLRVGMVHTPSADLTTKLIDRSGARTTAYGVSTVSQVAATAACLHCDYWVDAFVAHLQQMRDLAIDRLNRIPGIECRVPSGTYLLFPDIRGLGATGESLASHLLHDAKVMVAPGLPQWFGPGAEGHIRLCFATSRGLLEEALDRIEQSIRRMAT